MEEKMEEKMEELQKRIEELEETLIEKQKIIDMMAEAAYDVYRMSE